MPELPEVETVKRELTKHLIGITFEEPIIYYAGMIKTPLKEYQSGLKAKTIESLDRKGKFLIFNLNDDHKVIFHLRMEGKLFIVDKKNHSSSHLSMFIPFKNKEEGLAFYDVRKFGVSYYLKKEDLGPLEELGPEPFDIKDSSYLFDSYSKSNKPIKELLLDQTIMSGLGNIYADEVCFASRISPFMKGNMITKENAKSILDNSISILNLAIKSHGSTVRSYKASQEVSGSFQKYLKVYSHQGDECSVCHTFKIEKRRLNGRGTSYCPKCQHTGISLGITGKIGSGKSLATSYFKDFGYKVFSSDDEIHRLYHDPDFLLGLKKKFPAIFTPYLDKTLLSKMLLEDKTFRRKFEGFLYPLIRKACNEFIIENDGFNKAVEVPLLFDARMQKDFTYLVGVETTIQDTHLEERGDKNISDRLKFNSINSYDKHRHELDFVLTTNGPKSALKDQVEKIVKEIAVKLN